MSRFRRPAPPPPRQPPSCQCGNPSAPYGIGPPLQDELRWYCATCHQFHPATQAAIADRVRAASEE